MSSWLALLLALGAAPEVNLPPKADVVLAVTAPRAENAEAIRAGVRAARPAFEKCAGDAACWCAALKKVRLDGGTLVVAYPLVGHTGPSFTLNSDGRVIDCQPGDQK